MGWQDRDYHQTGGGFASRFAARSVVTWMIALNAATFMWDGIFMGSRRGSALALLPHGYFSVDLAVYSGQVWRFVTYPFFHWDLPHILFNMIGLYFFGPMMERWWGGRRFAAFYLLCGIGGAAAATLLGAIPGLHILPTTAAVAGASGSLFGILVGCAALFPRQRVMLLFPPIPMTLRTMAILFLVVAALSLIAGSPNAGGEAAHLGGALLGFVLVKHARLLDWADRLSPGAIRRGTGDRRRKKAQVRQQQADAEVDRILDKVRREGLASLTRGEKKTLSQATDRQREVG